MSSRDHIPRILIVSFIVQDAFFFSYITTKPNFCRVDESVKRVSSQRFLLDRLQPPDVWKVVAEHLIKLFHPDVLHAASCGQNQKLVRRLCTCRALISEKIVREWSDRRVLVLEHDKQRRF